MFSQSYYFSWKQQTFIVLGILAFTLQGLNNSLCGWTQARALHLSMNFDTEKALASQRICWNEVAGAAIL